MRILFFLVLSILSCATQAQTRTINYTATDKELTQIFKELEKTYDLHFAYAVEEIKGRKISIEAVNKDFPSFLQTLLGPQQLTFEIIEEGFISVTKASSILVRMKVSDLETGEALSFATAKLKGTNKGYIADVHGRLEFVLSKPSETILELSFLGYEKKDIEINTIDPSGITSIRLDRGAKELKEIVIKEYLNKGITTDDRASKISIDTQDMEILPGLSERDILLSTQILAGIGSADESAGGLSVRGSSRDNTFIYWNKIPVYQPAHYFGNISSFIPSAIGQVDIYKNYIPVSYGGSSSGLLLINSRKPIENQPIIETNLNLTHGDIYASVPFAGNNGKISIGGRRSFNDVVATPTFNSISNKLFEGSLTEDVQEISENFQYNSQLVFSDINMVIDLTPTGRNDFSLSMLRSESKLNYNSVDDENFQQSIQTHNVNTFGANFSWTRRWADKLSSELSVSFADYHMDYSLNDLRNEEDETENDRQERVNDLENLESRFSWTYAPTKNHIIEVGYQFNKIKTGLTISEDFFFEEDFSESISSDGNTHGLFADYFGKFNSGLQLGLGVRHNFYSALEDTRFDRQVRLNYQVSPSLLLKSTAGVYHQYISTLKEVDFVFSNTIEQNWITADSEEEIPVIRNEQLVVGGLFTKGGWVVDVDGYIKQVLAPVAWNFGFRPEDDEVLISGEERILGMDLTVKRRWKYYRAWVSYTYLDSEVEVDDSSFPSGLNIKHQLQLSQTLTHNQFEFSIGYTVRSGLPFTAATGFEQIAPEEPEDEPVYEINYAPLNSSRLPVYQRLDISAWYKFKAKKSSDFRGEIGVSVLNVLNRDNFYSRAFSIEENEEERLFLLRNDRQLIGISPNLSLRLRF